ncbi:ribonuclease HII [Flagellimonas sp.]|uniref:ribonuclease HII n=1 Tax=Flagellimonas sp. TaxID=2058762 RepID=UPI003F4A07BC
MKPQVIYLFLLICCISCRKEIKTSDTLLQQLPPNTSFYIKVNDMASFLSQLKNSLVSREGQILNFIDLIEDKSETLALVQTDKKALLGFYQTGRKDDDFILVVKSEPDFFDVTTQENYKVETLTYENYILNKHVFNSTEVFTSQKNGFQLLSSSQMLLENALRTESYSASSKLNRLYKASSDIKTATVFINLNASSATSNPMAEWTSLDISLDQSKTALNGVAIASDSTKMFINLFKGTAPLANRTPLYAPAKTEAMLSYSFDHYDVFLENQSKYLDRVKAKDTLFNTVEEIGVIRLNQQKVVFLNSFGPEGLSDFLSSQRTSSLAYQGSDIHGFQNKDLLTSSFNPLIADFESNYYTVLDNTFIFAETMESLQTVISNYRNKSTFSESTTYKTAINNLASESSMLFISDNKGADFLSEQPFLAEIFKIEESKKLNNHTIGAQLVADTHFMHTYFLVSETEKASSNNTTVPLFNVELDSDLAINPVFVKNHRNNKQEIVVQDRDNFLYLISTNGKVLWKKQLEGRIQGKIHQVDLYKNGRLQLAFCTNNEFLVIDRNGDDVPPFKIKFEGGNLNPLAVFDYEGNRDYRFLITQGKKVYMYNNKAQIVNGFTFKEATSDIEKAPKHFRVSNKDYLLFQLADNSLKILHRAGRERIPVKQKIDFSDNEIFLYRNKFSATNTKGVLVQVDLQGNISSANFNLNKDHGMYATSKTLVLMNDNILSIKGKKVELDLGVYSKPKIFYIYDKIYVSVTDIQNQKIYLYDSQAKPISNFPVFGNSLIDMTDIDNDRKLELVAKDQANSLIVYKLN